MGNSHPPAILPLPSLSPPRIWNQFRRVRFPAAFHSAVISAIWSSMSLYPLRRSHDRAKSCSLIRHEDSTRHMCRRFLSPLSTIHISASPLTT